MNSSEIKSLIALRIQEFKERDVDKYSYKFMARKTGLSPSYIERAAKGKLADHLDAKKTMSLAQLVCQPEESRQIADVLVNDFIDESNLFLKAALVDQVEKQRANSNDEIGRALSEDEVFIAYALCSGPQGADNLKIRKVLGDAGIIGVKKLEKLNLVYEKDGRYFSKPGNSFNQFETIKKQLSILSRMYKPSNVGKEKNYVHIMTDGLNDEGIKKWQMEHRRHQSKLREIKNEFQGEIDVFSVGFMDTFLPN